MQRRRPLPNDGEDSTEHVYVWLGRLPAGEELSAERPLMCVSVTGQETPLITTNREQALSLGGVVRQLVRSGQFTSARLVQFERGITLKVMEAMPRRSTPGRS